MHLHICRPRSLVEREMRSTYTCIIDSLPVLGLVQINNVGCFAKDPRKTGERPGSLLQGSAHRRQTQVARANDGDCLHLICTQVNCDYRVCKHNCSSHNGSRAHAANKRAWRWSRERFAKETFFSRRWRFPETGILINCHVGFSERPSPPPKLRFCRTGVSKSAGQEDLLVRSAGNQGMTPINHKSVLGGTHLAGSQQQGRRKQYVCGFLKGSPQTVHSQHPSSFHSLAIAPARSACSLTGRLFSPWPITSERCGWLVASLPTPYTQDPLFSGYDVGPLLKKEVFTMENQVFPKNTLKKAGIWSRG